MVLKGKKQCFGLFLTDDEGDDDDEGEEDDEDEDGEGDDTLFGL